MCGTDTGEALDRSRLPVNHVPRQTNPFDGRTTQTNLGEPSLSSSDFVAQSRHSIAVERFSDPGVPGRRTRGLWRRFHDPIRVDNWTSANSSGQDGASEAIPLYEKHI